MTEYWRDLMIVQCTGDENQALSVTGQQLQALKQQAARLKPDTVLAGLDILVTARTRLRAASQGRVLVEMAVVRLSRLDDLVSLAQLAQWAASREVPPATAGGPPRAPQVAPQLAVKAEKLAPADSEKKNEPAVTSSPSSGPSGSLTPEFLIDIWPQVISECGFALTMDLRKGEPAISGPNALVLRFPAGYNHTVDASKQARLEEVIRKVIGPNVVVRLDNGPLSTGGPPSAEPAVRQPPAAVQAPTTKAKRSRSEVAQLPLVKKAMDVLGAQVVHLDEDFDSAAPTSAPAPAPSEEALPSANGEAEE
jgi:DNA polymerase-3 subunit gamma/tau